MTISTSHSGAIEGYEPVHVPSQVVRVRAATAMFRRLSVQSTRRALLHIQAAGGPAVAPDLVSWFTERAFHFYLAGLRLPGPAPYPVNNLARRLHVAFADLDMACAHLRVADGIDNVIVMASGQAAAAVALWSDARQQADPAKAGGLAAADALILHAPEFPARPVRSLSIGCPVLVLSGARGRPSADSGRRRRQRRRPEATTHLGDHVTWLHLGADGAARNSPGTGGRAYFDELGRWLGAYMYGQGRDQLL